MENLFLYFVKTSGLIGLFYLSYMFLLRKETFFSANRWFLLSGLFTSTLLPFYFITKIVWVEPTSDSIDWTAIPVTSTVVNPEPKIDWFVIVACIYLLGTAILLFKLLFDFYSLSKVFKNKTRKIQGKYKLIEVTENIAPFSFFKTIVYNSSLYTETELTNILEHEKIHSSQFHSMDILVARLISIVFWFNPFIWLYKNAMIQNLEFIADNEASKNIADKKVYQLTLLKITTQENCVSLTNHFYQSLIKKRIIMLNKNQSNKWNSWKYITVFPALIAFVLLFQIEIVAQEKEVPKQENNNIIQGDTLTVNNFIIQTDTLKLVGNEKSNQQNNNTIKVQGYGDLSNIEYDINGKKASKAEFEKLDPKEIEKIDVATISGKKTILVTTKHLSKPVKISDKTIYIDGIKSTEEEFAKLDKNSIDKIDVNTFENTIRITTKNSNKSKQEETKNKETDKIEEQPNNKIIKSYLKEYYIDGKKSTAYEYSKLDLNKIKKVETDRFNNKVFITTKKTEEIKKTIPEQDDKNSSFSKINDENKKSDPTIDFKKTFKKALVIIDGKESNLENLLKITNKNIKFTNANIFEESTDESKKIILATYGEKARNGVLVVETSPIK